jgi:hypothetical protein
MAVSPSSGRHQQPGKAGFALSLKRSFFMAIEPVVYGGSTHPTRGDYSRGGQVGADYTCPQNHAAYTPADHDTYRRLYERQSKLLPGLACDAFIAALPSHSNTAL